MRTIITVLFFLFGTIAFSQSETIRVKAEIKTGQLGYTGHAPISAFKNLSERNPWKKTEYKIYGVPEGEGWYRTSVWFQTYQWTYQNYKQGKIDSARFAELMESWRFDTVPGQYSSKEVLSSSVLIYRKTEGGSVEYYVDTDGDRDFSDEKMYYAIKGLNYSKVDSVLDFVPEVTYELYLNGEAERNTVPFIVEQGHFKNMGDYITYTMPVYAEAIIGEDTIIVNTSKADFEEIAVSKLSEIDQNAKRNTGKKIEKGGRVKYAARWYTIDHFDRSSNELVLRVVDTKTDTVSASKGFYAPDFRFEEMDSGKKLKLSDLQGKYVLIDFWGTWCKPCVGAIPELVSLKEELKDEPFELLSIACFSEMESFESLRATHGMKWLHMWHPSHDGIAKEYNVTGYPTMVLIDPKGKILGYDIGIGQVKELLLGAEKSVAE